MEKNNESLPFISFIFNHNYYYILLYWILEIIVTLVQKSYPDYFILFKEASMNELTDVICKVLGDLLAGFLVLYTKCTMKFTKKQLKKKNSKNEIKLIYNNIEKEKHNNSVCLIILISILHMTAVSVYFLFHLFIGTKENDNSTILENHQMDWLICVDFLLRHIFARIILKTSLYKHNKLSLYICSFGFFFMTVSDGFSIWNGNKDIKVLFFIFFIFPRVMLFSLADVLNKKILIDDFFLPQKLMFYRGGIELFLLLIIIPILYFTSKLNLDIIQTDLSIKIIIKSLYIIISFLKAFFLMKVIDIFTAQYVSFVVVAECFGSTLSYSYQIIKTNIYNKQYIDLIQWIVDILSLIVILFGTLLYNEMIIINRYGLNKNTKNGLLISETKEMNSLDENDLEKTLTTEL